MTTHAAADLFLWVLGKCLCRPYSLSLAFQVSLVTVIKATHIHLVLSHGFVMMHLLFIVLFDYFAQLLIMLAIVIYYHLYTVPGYIHCHACCAGLGGH